MHIFYVDESYDTAKFAMTALGIKAEYWRSVLDATNSLRREFAREYGIYMRAELHASEFVRNCSDGISRRKLSLEDRRDVFGLVMKHIASSRLRLFNISQRISKWGTTQKAHMICIERLANRIEGTMKDRKSYAVTVIDAGKEKEITRLLRKNRVFNPIPSKFGKWEEGPTRNIVLERMIEDPFFKDSKSSYLLQLADFAAFALLKKEVPPTPFVRKWGYDKMFGLLTPVLFRQAHQDDPNGIIR